MEVSRWHRCLTHYVMNYEVGHDRVLPHLLGKGILFIFLFFCLKFCLFMCAFYAFIVKCHMICK